MKGLDRPKFTGEDGAKYEPWKAAFIFIVDVMDIPVGEKVLRLQSSLTGKALALIKDLGFSVNAYEERKRNSKGSMEERGVHRLNTWLLCVAGKRLDPEIWRKWRAFEVYLKEFT